MNFFSSNSYIFLPTKNNPKVALCVDNSKLAKNAFKLYNPFSLKAKILKNISSFSFMTLNLFAKLFATTKERSEFVIYLEKLLDQDLVVSLYFATAKDKVVLQLQSKDAKILGYLKYPISKIGLIHIQNEIKAFEILSSNKTVEPYLLSQEYMGKPFLFLKELDGTIDTVSKKDIDNILEKFKKEDTFTIGEHPRIKQIKEHCQKNDMQEYISKIDEICEKCTLKYSLVYEHGDFAPWNILKVKEEYIPFDFEYFVEDGLEYLDMIKYYYQIGILLENKEEEELYKFVKKKVDIVEFKELFELYLIKEIVRKKEENESLEFEKNMIRTMEKI